MKRLLGVNCESHSGCWYFEVANSTDVGVSKTWAQILMLGLIRVQLWVGHVTCQSHGL